MAGNDGARGHDDLDAHKHLDEGLKMAFGGESSGSVLDAIESISGIRSRVLLRDAPEDASPILRVAPRGGEQGATDDSRYQIVGEIARGGVGVVYKGRDKDLGRDVALKVLRTEFAAEDSVIQRFIEEAQVGGQLQHPGIVPIYGLGLQAEGQPYFAMKLVKGDTLTALIEQGKKGSELLGAFEQVAQAVAYAHSRGVIHRDLKPSNVMVGAFGEVQVVDWGFAKVLGREDTVTPKPGDTTVTTVRTGGEGSQSVAGSVMGTPAYMPPEQAMGQIDELTPRADVFSLGAILCEILTRQPPYTGTMQDQLLAAAQVRLDDAHARIDACNAPEAVKQIARDCMAPLPKDRPSDAGVVAQRIADHLASVEERARKSELEAVKSDAEARQARRARRTAIALAAVALFALVGGGLGYAAWNSSERERAEAAAARVGPLLREATQLEGEKKWTDAKAAAVAAVTLAETGGADAETIATAQALRARIASRAKAADAHAAKLERESDLIHAFDEIAIQSFDVTAAQLEHKYTDAFFDFGLDAANAETAMALADFGRPVTLAVHLDRWARARRKLKRADWTTLDRLARALDDDPWRNRLRDNAVRKDAEELRALAASSEFGAQQPSTLVWLAAHLADVDDLESAVAILRRARVRHPGNFWIHNRLAAFLWWRLYRPDEALPHAKAAIALRPDSAGSWFLLGDILLGGTRDYEGSLRACRRAAQLDPDNSYAHTGVGSALHHSGDVDGAIVEFREAIRLDPKNSDAHADLGESLLVKGDVDGAVASLREAIRVSPEYTKPHLNLGSLLGITLGRIDEGLAEVREAIRLDPRTAEAHTSLGSLLSLKGDIDGAAAAHREAIRLDPRDAVVRANYGALLCDHRRQYDKAIAEFREALRLDPNCFYAQRCLGIAHEFKGDLEGAVKAFRKALRIEPGNVMLRLRLGGLLNDRLRRYDEAIVEFREALRREPHNARAHSNFGLVLLNTGDFDGAVTQARESIRIEPGLAHAHYILGEALGQTGDLRGSADAFRKLAAMVPKDAQVQQKLAEAEQAAAHHARVPAVLAGKHRPTNAKEWLAFADICYRAKEYTSSARFWQEAFQRKPELATEPRTGNRYNAGCSAALAGETWHARAFEWLRADLDAWQKAPRADAPMVAQAMQHWQRDPDLASVRDGKDLSADWKKFWADVATLREEVSK